MLSEDINKRPIGVFDSGIGGLTVLREIARLMPGEDTVYLGDTARVPYGSKSKETVIRYSREVAGFLAGRGVKLIVVACNTASAYGLGELKKTLAIPVIGVIEPGARAAKRATAAGRIGIIGTEGTIRSNSYVNAINALSGDKTRSVTEHGEKGFDRYFEIETDVLTVFTKACPLFVPLAEEGWTSNDVARLTAEHYLNGIKGRGVDALVLGCTHYPILKDTIAGVMGPGVKLIDSAEATAEETRRALAGDDMLNGAAGGAKREFFVTDSPERFVAVGKRFFGPGLDTARLVTVGA